LDIWGDHLLEEPFIDSGGTDVGREFSSDFEDGGERRKMDVWEDFEGIDELEEVEEELFRANKTIIGKRKDICGGGSNTWGWDHQQSQRVREKAN
jgi:hypothetical protein